MTTTPSVADVLGGPTTGAPGVFPDKINLAFNEHVRHHLVHFPDIAVRSWRDDVRLGHSSTLPQADRTYFSPAELELALEVDSSRIELGEPLPLTWTLTNRSSEPFRCRAISPSRRSTPSSTSRTHGNVRRCRRS